MPAKTGKIDAAEHLGMLHHVVHSSTLNIPGNMKEEAVSEGMVLLVEAAKSYDPKHGVPAHYWIAKKLRWGLLNWKLRELSRHGLNDSYDVTCMSHGSDGHPAVEDIELQDHDWALVHEIRELLEECQRDLPDDVFLAIIGPAMGLQMKELSHVLKANPNQIKALQERGRKYVQEMRML